MPTTPTRDELLDLADAVPGASNRRTRTPPTYGVRRLQEDAASDADLMALLEERRLVVHNPWAGLEERLPPRALPYRLRFAADRAVARGRARYFHDGPSLWIELAT